MSSPETKFQKQFKRETSGEVLVRLWSWSQTQEGLRVAVRTRSGDGGRPEFVNSMWLGGLISRILRSYRGLSSWADLGTDGTG